MCKYSKYLLSIVILIIFSFFHHALAEEIEDAQRHLKQANMFYWLSRIRNGSQVEILRCEKEYDQTYSILNQIKTSLNNSEPANIELLEITEKLLTQAKDGKKQVYDQKKYAKHFLENYSPILRLLSKKDDIIVRYDLNGLVSVRNSLKNLLSEHPLLWRGTLYMFIISETQNDEPSTTEVEEATQAYLNTNSNHYIIPRHELREFLTEYEINDVYSKNPSTEVLEKICSTYGSKAIEGIGILRVGKVDKIGNISRTEANFQYWNRGSNTWGLSYYAMGFSEKRNRLAVVALLLPLFGLPMALFYRRKTNLIKGTPSPFWLPVSSSIISIFLLLLVNFSIGKLNVDLNQLWYAPIGIFWILAISVMYTLLPILGSYGVSALSPNIGKALNRPDTTASIVAGSFLGGLALLTNLAWIRMGNSPGDIVQIISIAGCGIILTIMVGYRAGYAWFKWTVIRERISILVIVVLILICVLFNTFLLTWNIKNILPVTLIGLVAILGLKPLVKVTISQHTDNDDYSNQNHGLIENKVLYPDFVATQSIQKGLDNAIHFLTNIPDPNIVSVIYIEGHEGCGKTRFAWEVANRIKIKDNDQGTNCIVLYGDNDNPDNSSTITTYAPFVHALGGILGVNRLADPEQNIHKLRNMVNKVGLKGLGALSIGILGTVLDVAGLGGKEPRQTSEGEIAYVIAQTLYSLSDSELREKKHVLFIIDDCQWCNSESIRLLGKILESLHQPEVGQRVSFIITSRPGNTKRSLQEIPIREFLKAKHNQDLIRLHIDFNSLELAEKRGEFVNGLLDGLGFVHRAKMELSSKCSECGCGRPLHILGMLQKVVSNHWAIKEGSRYILAPDADLSQIRMSDHFSEMLKDEFKDIDPKLCDILQCCAAIGQEFKASIVSNILKNDIFETLQFLDEAEKRNIIQDVFDQDDVFCFREKRVAWYFRSLGFISHSNIPCQKVREYHKRYVQLIEDSLSKKEHSNSANTIPQQDLIDLAYHTNIVRDVWPEKTIYYNKRLGELSYKQGIFAKAISLFQVVDDVLNVNNHIGTNEERFSFYLTFAHCLLDMEVDLNIVNRYIEKLKGMDTEQIEKELREDFWTLEVLLILRMRKFQDAYNKATQIIDSMQLLEKNRLRLQFYIAASISNSDKNNIQNSIKAHLEVLDAVDNYLSNNINELQRCLEVEILKGEILNNLGFRYLYLSGSENKAMDYFKQALKIKEKPECNDLKGIAMVHGGLGDCYFKLQRLKLAKEEYEKDYTISRNIGDQKGICRMGSMLGKIALLEANEVNDKKSRSSLIEIAKQYYDESLYMARSRNDLLSILFAINGLLQVVVLYSDEDKVEFECTKIQNIINSQDMTDKIDLDYIRSDLIQTLQLLQKSFPKIAEKLVKSMDFL